MTTIRVTSHKSGWSMFDFPRRMLNKHYEVKFAGGMIHVKQVRIEQSKKIGLYKMIQNGSTFVLTVPRKADHPTPGFYKFLIDEQAGIIEAFGEFVRPFNHGKTFNQRQKSTLEKAVCWLLRVVR